MIGMGSGQDKWSPISETGAEGESFKEGSRVMLHQEIFCILSVNYSGLGIAAGIQSFFDRKV